MPTLVDFFDLVRLGLASTYLLPTTYTRVALYFTGKLGQVKAGVNQVLGSVGVKSLGGFFICFGITIGKTHVSQALSLKSRAGS